MFSNLKIALAQLNFLVGDTEGNSKKVIEAAIHARDELKADIVVFSELSITGYPLEDLLFRPVILRRVSKALEDIKRSVSNIYIILGAPTSEGRLLHNSALVIYNANIIAIYHKNHLPNYEVFDEVRYFKSGTKACVVEIKNVKVGITICEDIWFHEPGMRSVEAGAEIIISMNASPYHIDKNLEREKILKDRIKQLKVPFVYINQIGGQDELVFDGESLCFNKAGEKCLHAPAFEESLLAVEYSLEESDLLASKYIQSPLPKLASIYQAILLGVKDYVIKNNFNGVVIGLSGGIDSALTLALAVDALGVDRVHTIMMPFKHTSDMSIEDSNEMACALGVKFDEIPIGNLFDSFMKSLDPIFSGLEQDVTEENIQSRIRGVLLMSISNKTGKMLLTTGNKSEISVGYATLYGDMAGGFAPLKDVSKTLVYELAIYRNRLGNVIPERIITRPPSAELAPNQIDEDSLPPYDILDPILEKYVEQDLTIDQIVEDGFDNETVNRVASMVLRNEYKRRQSPPGVKITRRAFGKDRRYPITSGFK